MESYEFSHNDILHRIEANPNCYLKLFIIDSNDDVSPFFPPQENRYDQILRVRFGLSQDAFEKMRKDWLASWKITDVTFYNSAFAIRHVNVFDKPVLKQPGVRTFHGIRAEQAFIETIPYDNISPHDFTIRIDMKDESKKSEASWILTTTDDVLSFITPADMNFDRPRVHL